jgi:hypothetical protein
LSFQFTSGETDYDLEMDVSDGCCCDCGCFTGAGSRPGHYADYDHADPADDHHRAEHDANYDDPADGYAGGSGGDDNPDHDHRNPADYDA